MILAFLAGQHSRRDADDVGATILAQYPGDRAGGRVQLLSSPSQMAVKKGETALKEALDKAIADMKADGSLNDVAVKWLKQPLAKDFCIQTWVTSWISSARLRPA